MANGVQDKVRDLQIKLYLAAKRSPTRRFHALYDKVYRRDVLERAWREVEENHGAAGVDGDSIEAITEQGVEAFLAELGNELREGRYQPLPVRRVSIPKAGGKGTRNLGIPAVRDRVVAAAVKVVIEPIFEADFLECSWGFRPKRSAHQAIERIRGGIRRGNCWVVDADIQSFFDEIPRGKLALALRERVSDRQVIGLIQSWLRAGVLVGGSVLHPERGTPQGGVASPLLANVYLHQLDRVWAESYRHLGELTRYCDDLVIVCRTKAEAEAALEVLGRLLAELGLQVAEAKTRLVGVDEGEGFDFLGFHHRKVRSVRNPSVRFLASWPGHVAMQRARGRVREILARRQLLRPVSDVITDVNRFLRGWGGYFRRGNSTRHFNRLDRYVTRRVARFISMKCDHPGFGYGLRVIVGSGNDLGLYRLVGTVGRAAVQTVR
ncbi:MAG: group II intron reverse transcriptase/maturase [Candidatus Methylomirabilis sp.]